MPGEEGTLSSRVRFEDAAMARAPLARFPKFRKQVPAKVADFRNLESYFQPGRRPFTIRKIIGCKIFFPEQLLLVGCYFSELGNLFLTHIFCYLFQLLFLLRPKLCFLSREVRFSLSFLLQAYFFGSLQATFGNEKKLLFCYFNLFHDWHLSSQARAVRVVVLWLLCLWDNALGSKARYCSAQCFLPCSLIPSASSGCARSLEACCFQYVETLSSNTSACGCYACLVLRLDAGKGNLEWVSTTAPGRHHFSSCLLFLLRRVLVASCFCMVGRVLPVESFGHTVLFTVPQVPCARSFHSSSLLGSRSCELRDGGPMLSPEHRHVHSSWLFSVQRVRLASLKFAAVLSGSVDSWSLCRESGMLVTCNCEVCGCRFCLFHKLPVCSHFEICGFIQGRSALHFALRHRLLRLRLLVFKNIRPLLPQCGHMVQRQEFVTRTHGIPRARTIGSMTGGRGKVTRTPDLRTCDLHIVNVFFLLSFSVFKEISMKRHGCMHR